MLFHLNELLSCCNAVTYLKKEKMKLKIMIKKLLITWARFLTQENFWAERVLRKVDEKFTKKKSV